MTNAMLAQEDIIDNATYDVCCSFLSIPPDKRDEQFPWDIQILSTVREAIIDALLQHGKGVCYPYVEYNPAEKSETYCKKDDCHCNQCVREEEIRLWVTNKFKKDMDIMILILETGEFLKFQFSETSFLLKGCDESIDYTLYNQFYQEKDGGQMDYCSSEKNYSKLEDAIPDIISFALNTDENTPGYHII